MKRAWTSGSEGFRRMRKPLLTISPTLCTGEIKVLRSVGDKTIVEEEGKHEIVCLTHQRLCACFHENSNVRPEACTSIEHLFDNCLSYEMTVGDGDFGSIKRGG